MLFKNMQYNFEGRFDLVQYVKLIQKAGLYVSLRIGPYIESEWNYGGFPFWLHDIPDIVFRTDNEPFKKEMKKFTEKIVNMMKDEGLFASQGGPIILAQYHGGTNFGRSGGPFVTTSYDYDAPIDEYGVIRQPKWGHLKDLHAAIKLCSDALLLGKPSNFWLGSSQEAHIYTGESGLCAAFLSNRDAKSDVTVNFQDGTYDLPAWSVSILPDCKNVAFNTAQVNAQSNSLKLAASHVKPSSSKSLQNGKFNEGMDWEMLEEEIGVFGDIHFTAKGLLEHINTTKDTTDYLWYTISIDVDQDEPIFTSNVPPVLIVESRGYAVDVFINNKLLDLYDSRLILSGLQTTINAPDGDEPVALDLTSMGKGQIWVNDENIGRYWVSLLAPPGDCSMKCDYRGNYSLHKCESGCGQPSQRLYHVPRSLLKPTGNLLVLFEEIGGNPSNISLLTRSINSICAHISETYLPSVLSWEKIGTDSQMLHKNLKPKLQLECSMGKMISSIKFASFGNPHGVCGDFNKGTCHSVGSRQAIEMACLGQHGCSITVSSEDFGGDPCIGTLKSLAVEAMCS